MAIWYSSVLFQKALYLTCYKPICIFCFCPGCRIRRARIQQHLIIVRELSCNKLFIWLHCKCVRSSAEHNVDNFRRGHCSYHLSAKYMDAESSLTRQQHFSFCFRLGALLHRICLLLLSSEFLLAWADLLVSPLAAVLCQTCSNKSNVALLCLFSPLDPFLDLFLGLYAVPSLHKMLDGDG